MIRVLIGHRGAGKTSLLSRLQEYFGASSQYYDLDQEIAVTEGCSVTDIFATKGEAYFRDLETQVFERVRKDFAPGSYIVLGAGYPVTSLPSTVEKWWVRRETDLEGRIFTDRPRLDLNKDPLSEFLHRAQPREAAYSQIKDRVYTIPEGDVSEASPLHFQQCEKAIFEGSWSLPKVTMTLMPDFSWLQLKDWVRARVQIEMRDDLLADELILQILNDYPQGNFLFSFRRKRNRDEFWQSHFWHVVREKARMWDWAWELGTPEEFLKRVPSKQAVLSLHGAMDEAMDEDWLKYEKQVRTLKWSPLVETWSELVRCHEWKSSIFSRSLLPRSHDGKWKWYRQYLSYRQELHFVREGAGSAKDQPTLIEALMAPLNLQAFAAVLGSPVKHSYSPLEHSEDFYKRQMAFWSIDISKAEFWEAFDFLKEIGLKAAAVTSPLKELAAKLCQKGTLEAVNTLWISEQREVEGVSTDDIGFEALVAVHQSNSLDSETVVWGGGGTLEVLKRSLPRAQFYSSSQAVPRQGSGEPSRVQNLIWAAPRLEGTLFPPKQWQPKWIYDLNYKEDSMGREYAQQVGAHYVSGLVMFKAQAQAQKKYWNTKFAEEAR